MTIAVTPISNALGASITGIDLSKPLGDDAFGIVHSAMLEHLVLVFPDQELTDEEQVEFTLRFGDLPDRGVHSRGTKADDQLHKSVMLVSNIRENGEVIGSIPDGEMFFHTDGSYEEAPYRYTLLYAIEVPKNGGDTLFANMYAAYETLPDDLKELLADIDAEHGFYAGPDVTEEMRIALRVTGHSGSARHPALIRHEESSRTVLYVSRMLTRRLIGLGEDRGRDLLFRLFDHSERAENVYRHVWTPGDLVMWDNRCTNHARTDFSAGERRLLRRTTCQGTRPERAAP